ncbi:MAG: lycopene cyclase [Flavobacteriales bacterium]|nr:lycopene cyclase [Flavobacteriales bacterium]|tara:strand:+ start:100942 stop:101643 length:702 start_codon:yes stop_codon:yes gene_type:complete
MSTYFQVLFFSFLIPFLFSFHPKINFYKTWSAFFLANFLVSIPFLIWDEIFVRIDVWGFNNEHLSGLTIFSLPIEEILFFIVIPYCCVFTYEVLSIFFAKVIFSTKTINFIFGLILFILSIIFSDRLYTFYTFFTLGLFLIFLFKYNKSFMKDFYITYFLITVTFFIIVNGILTGGMTGGPLNNPPVWYNNSETLNIRFWTIPIEDFFYSFLLLLSNTYFYEFFKIKLYGKKK